MNTARFELDLGDIATATAVAAALAPEAAESPEGAKTVIEAHGQVVRVVIEAEDLSTLRAAMNSALRLLDAAHGSASR